LPVAYSSSNTLNWTNDVGASGTGVNDYVNCSDGGSSNTKCNVPVSMGFSAYTISTPSSGNGDTSPGGGGSSGSSGGGAVVLTNATSNVSYATLDEMEGDADSSGEEIAEDTKGDETVTYNEAADKKWGIKQFWFLIPILAGGVIAFFVARHLFERHEKRFNEKVKVVKEKLGNKLVLIKNKK